MKSILALHLAVLFLSTSLLSSVSKAQIVAPEVACKVRARTWITEAFTNEATSDIELGPISFKNYAGNDGKLKRAVVAVTYTEILTNEKTGKKRFVNNETQVGIIVQMNKISCTLGSLGVIE